MNWREIGRRYAEWASLFSGRIFVQLVSYADESGTGGLDPCVCGYIAPRGFWDKFCEQWTAGLASSSIPALS